MIQEFWEKLLKEYNKFLLLSDKAVSFLEKETAKDYANLIQMETNEEEIINNLTTIFNNNVKNFILGHYSISESINYLNKYFTDSLEKYDEFTTFVEFIKLLNNLNIEITYNDIDYLMYKFPILKKIFDASEKHDSFKLLIETNNTAFAFYTNKYLKFDFSKDTSNKKNKKVDPIVVYHNDVDKINPVDEEMEKLLIERIKQGDSNAYNTLLERNVRLVLSIANKYGKSKEEILDLIQEGALGLYDAVEKFDSNKANKFSTYAVWHIKKKILAYLETNLYCLTINRYDSGVLSKIKKAQKQAMISIGRELNITELSDETSLSERVIMNCLKIPTFISLNSLYDNEFLLKEYGDYLTYEEDFFRNSSEDVIELMEKAKLTPNETYVLKARYGFINGECLYCKDIAEKLNTSVQNISQTEKRAINRLRVYILKHYNSEDISRSIERVKLLVNKK